ncbi:putative quinol monooxygenase [Sphingomonas bacterium]|uniref:putative quinol monooxygenase n=1 Tax=Sphingomonas bacterium TaxID=1895847 RepID=UPI001576CB4B|nr:putative quinol monooxygenase [Sphingomonas bacterium]
MTQTPALLIYTSYRLLPDNTEAFRALALRMATAARGRDGCAFLDVAQDAADPATFRLIEGWRDQAALDAHGASDEFQAVMKEAGALKVVDRSIDLYSVADKKTVGLPS